jgi:hypothetical protein
MKIVQISGYLKRVATSAAAAAAAEADDLGLASLF